MSGSAADYIKNDQPYPDRGSLFWRNPTTGVLTPISRLIPGTIQVSMQVIDVSSSAVQVLAASIERRYLAFMNVGTVRITLGNSNAVAAGAGYPLEPATAIGAQGGGLFFEASAVPENAFWAISGGAAKLLVVTG